MNTGTVETQDPECDVKPAQPNADIPFVKQKRKTCRRGKKRKYKSPNGVRDESPKDDSAELCWHSETAECKKRTKNVLIRPVDAPKAPRNSTQFIMDDHDECHLYMSFETPDPYQNNSETSTEKLSTCNSSVGIEDAAFQDVDYVYHSMNDRDSNAYYLQDFENSYTNMRYEELLRLQKPELIVALEKLEIHINELETKLYEQDPSSALEQLQHQLLQLQEENLVMHKLNDHLKSLAQNMESCDKRVINQPNEEEHSLSDGCNSGSEQSCDGCENCCSETENGRMYLNRYKDFKHLAIDDSSGGSHREVSEERESIDIPMSSPHSASFATQLDDFGDGDAHHEGNTVSMDMQCDSSREAEVVDSVKVGGQSLEETTVDDTSENANNNASSLTK